MTAVLEKIARAIGEVPANATDDVRHVLSEGAIERVARAALLALRNATDDTMLNGSIICARLDMILAEPAS